MRTSTKGKGKGKKRRPCVPLLGTLIWLAAAQLLFYFYLLYFTLLCLLFFIFFYFPPNPKIDLHGPLPLKSQGLNIDFVLPLTQNPSNIINFIFIFIFKQNSFKTPFKLLILPIILLSSPISIPSLARLQHHPLSPLSPSSKRTCRHKVQASEIRDILLYACSSARNKNQPRILFSLGSSSYLKNIA